MTGRPTSPLQPSRRRLVVEMNHWRAGFFVYLEFVINAILYCEENPGYVVPPKVEFGEMCLDRARNRYFEEAYGANVFDYYFFLRQEGGADLEQAVDERHDAAFFWNLHENVGIQCYPHGTFADLKEEYDQPYSESTHRWYYENRRRAHGILRDHIGIREEVFRRVEERWTNLFASGDFVVGCHIRGTDKMPRVGGRKIPPVEYFPFIDRLLDERNAKIFLATDDPGYCRKLHRRYGERVRFNPVERDEKNIFRVDRGSPYQKGLDVLVDCLMLSRCDFLLKCSSAVSEFAIFFNLDLHDRSLNLQYDCRRFLPQSPADGLLTLPAEWRGEVGARGGDTGCSRKIEHQASSVPWPRPGEREAPRGGQRSSTLVLQYANGRFGRAFMAELQCIFISYAYARANDFDYFLDDSHHPFLFAHGYDTYLVPDWPQTVDTERYQRVLVSCGDEFLQKSNRSATTIWDMLAFVRAHLSPRVFRHLNERLFRFQPSIEQQFVDEFRSLGLANEYAAVHIRRGDKIAEATRTGWRHEAAEYLDALDAAPLRVKDIFVCTDDIEAVRELQEELDRRRSAKRLYTRARERDTGYDMKGMIRRGEVMSEREIADLLIDTRICTYASIFVGTRSSNVWKVVKGLHHHPDRCLQVGE